MKRIFTYTLFIALSISVYALSLDDAKKLYNNGKYPEALPTFKESLSKSPNDASLNHWTGVCLYMTGKNTEAKPLLEFAQSKGVTESPRYLAHIAFEEYRFDDAVECISKYKAALVKAKKEIPDEIETLSTQIVNARNMLQRVEHIQIIDSINVDSETFFKFYKLSTDAGTLNAATILPHGFNASKNTIVFQPESKTQMFWATSDSSGTSQLVSSAILSDNTWETPHSLGDNLNDDGNANYPYIMPDGNTLYFANDGVNSIGGYDIFITRRDEEGFLQPQNMGMPYNSPYNDYMLVIDETTGIGWWATDRNRLEGKVTIYMFIPNDSRANHSPDAPNIVNLAKISSIKDSWTEGADYNDHLSRLNNLEHDNDQNISPHFALTLPNGKIYHSLSDFNNPAAATAMQEYLDAKKQYNDKQQQLDNLRKLYSAGNKSVSQQILAMENAILDDAAELTRLQNIAISLEMK